VPEQRQRAFTCPKCWMTSYHPEDLRHGFCGNCHDYTSPPLTDVRALGGLLGEVLDLIDELVEVRITDEEIERQCAVIVTQVRNEQERVRESILGRVLSYMLDERAPQESDPRSHGPSSTDCA
jgi:hypothetical protein